MSRPEVVASLHGSRPTQAQARPGLWKAAIKWPMYVVAVMPALVASGWLLGPGAADHSFHPLRLLLFLAAAILLLAWENLANDVYDADTGIDRHKAHSVVNLTGGRRDRVLGLANVCLLTGLALMAWLARLSDPRVFLLVLGCCALGYLYQGPPFRLGYAGLGEPLCWLAFGPLATAAALLALGGPLDPGLATRLGAGPALATTLVLFCSHFHQVEEDLRHGKRSPVQRLGTARAAGLVPWWIALTLALELAPALERFWPATVLLALAGLPAGVALMGLLRKHHDQPERISHSKFLALRFLTLNGLGFALGLALG